MREETRPPQGESQDELMEQLRSLEGPNSAATLAELAYRRAKEALERALDEAREIRLRAFEEARQNRERELAQTLSSLRALRESAESQIQHVLAVAETQAAQIQARARAEAEAERASAHADAEQIRAEAASLRAAADERAREVKRLEKEFDAVAAQLVNRLGLKAEPERRGFWARLRRKR